MDNRQQRNHQSQCDKKQERIAEIEKRLRFDVSRYEVPRTTLQIKAEKFGEKYGSFKK